MTVKINKKLLLHITIIVTVLSQFESVKTVFRPFMYGMWALLIVLGIIGNTRKIKVTRYTKVFALVCIFYFVFCAIASIVTTNNYFSGSYAGALIIPLGVCFCTGLYMDYFLYDDIISILKTYIIVAVVYGIYVNIIYFPSYSSWLSQIGYVFVSKNSAAQIWSIAMLLSFFLPKLTAVKRPWIWYVFSVYLLLICAFSQCRTALLGIAICVVIYVISGSTHKLRWSLIVGVLVIAALSHPSVRQFVNQSLLLPRYNEQGANAFSSGRINGYVNALESFRMHPIAGVGSYYIDCSYLMILAETGIIGLILLETAWITRITRNMWWNTKLNKWKKLISLVTIFYIVESVLEGLPPFGPGVSSFMFWMLCSMTVDNNSFQPMSNIEGLKSLE